MPADTLDGLGQQDWAADDWVLDGSQHPTSFARFAEGEGVAVVRIDGDSASGTDWRTSELLRSRRRTLVGEAMTPVRLRTPDRLWSADKDSLVEWDETTGRLLHAIAMPPCLGDYPPGPGAAADTASAGTPLPPALGSTRGGWIAQPFSLRLRAKPTAPASAPTDADADRMPAFGVTLVDTATGRSRRAFVGGTGAPTVLARSGDGRWLALAGAPASPQQAGTVWDTPTGRLALRPTGPADASGESTSSLSMLAFSWDGRSVWALRSGHLLEWPLPAAMATTGQATAPDQSR